jgi:two-component system, NarL family, sensor histidine kinase UhpB
MKMGVKLTANMSQLRVAGIFKSVVQNQAAYPSRSKPLIVAQPPPAQCPTMPTTQYSVIRTASLVALAALLSAPACAAQESSLAAPGLAGLLSGLALTLTLMALAHRWERRLFLVASACFAWAGLLYMPTRNHPTCLPLLCFLSLALLGLLLRLAGWRKAWHDALVLGPPTLLLVAMLVPATNEWAASTGPLFLGSELLIVAGAFLWHRWRVWLRVGLVRWQQWVEQLQYSVLPVLLSTATGGLALHWHRQENLPLPLSIGLLLVLLASGLVLGFAVRRQQTEQRLLQTEQQITLRLADLDRHHQQLSDQRLEQVTERERKRIASDLHDDLGAKLLTIVHTSDSERISSLAREALEEMRLSVRGLTGRPVQLLDAIGDWRAEVVSRLTQSNIDAEWVSLAEEVAHTLAARAYVQTTRVVREAISNVIKHSGASRCVIRCALADGDFQIIIQDNGKGIPTEKDGRLDRGHGMSSMKSRAKQMQGQCLVESGPGWGTLIRLSIPL